MTADQKLTSQQISEPVPITSAEAVANNAPDILALVGKRVRALRAQRGITRKMLAHDSSVSQRYLAQLEQGQGNISIGLLLKVATALHTSLAELVAVGNGETLEQALIYDFVRQMTARDQQRALRLIYDHFSSTDRNHNRIALIGLRGAGKTTLGRRLAEHHGLPFIQLVAQIETLAGLSVPEILALTGRSGYRRFEEQALLDVLADNDACVLESEELYTRKAGEEITGQLYRFEDKGGRSIALRLAGQATLAGGNLGEPALDLLLHEVPDFYVLELSSFQLQRTASLPLKVAVLLNISPDHLDWHASEDEYRSAKYRILSEAETAVVNRADDGVEQHLAAGLPRVSFGLDRPEENQFG